LGDGSGEMKMTMKMMYTVVRKDDRVAVIRGMLNDVISYSKK
jgi:hypothetical protein